MIYQNEIVCFMHRATVNWFFESILRVLFQNDITIFKIQFYI